MPKLFMLTDNQREATPMLRFPNFGVHHGFLFSFHSFYRLCRSADGLPILWQEQVVHAIKIGERQQREHPHRVFGQPPVADFHEPPQPFDHVEGVLHKGPHQGPLFVAGFSGFGERMSRGSASAGASACFVA